MFWELLATGSKFMLDPQSPIMDPPIRTEDLVKVHLVAGSRTQMVVISRVLNVKLERMYLAI